MTDIATKLRNKYGDDYFKTIGKKGGQVKVPKGFAKNPKLASLAGKKSRPKVRVK